jgi:hypothetical protein
MSTQMTTPTDNNSQMTTQMTTLDDNVKQDENPKWHQQLTTNPQMTTQMAS